MKLLHYFLLLFFIITFPIAKAQPVSCENLKTIINTIILHSDAITGNKIDTKDESTTIYESLVQFRSTDMNTQNKKAYIISNYGSKNAQTYREYFAEGLNEKRAQAIFTTYFHWLKLCDQTSKIREYYTMQHEKKASVYYYGTSISLIMRQQNLPEAALVSSIPATYSVIFEINYIENWDGRGNLHVPANEK